MSSNKTNQTVATGKISKLHYSILGLVISALVVGHFVMQMSFIGTETWRLDESLVKVEMPTEKVVEPNLEIEENVVEAPKMQTEIAKTDVVLDEKKVSPNKNVQIVKVAQKENLRRPAVAVAPISVKEKVKTPVKSERLRRAEKLLTGF